NLVIAWSFLRRLSDSRFTAAIGTLLFAYHPAFAELYYNNGTVYDVLCFCFLVLAMSGYVKIRRENRFLTPGIVWVIAALYGAALGSKEMAVTFPAFVVLY